MLNASVTIWPMVRKLLLSLSLVTSLLVGFAPSLVSAATCDDTKIKNGTQVKLGVQILPGAGNACVEGDPKNGGVIIAYVKIFLQFLSAGVGIVIILMLVIAGIQYITSTGNPAMIKGAKDRIVNAITALVLFVLSFAILSFLIPGGIFG